MITIDVSVSLEYPRIEMYREVDMGNPNAAKDSWDDGKGGRFYGGARDFKPCIERTTYVLTGLEDELLALPLNLLPGYGINNIQLKTYFNALKNDKAAFRSLFPENLNSVNAYRKQENFRYSDHAMFYEDLQVSGITIVWLDAEHWFVDHFFYEVSNLAPLLEKRTPAVELVAEGEMKDFIRFFAPFQLKLGEGFADLKPDVKEPVLRFNEPVFTYTLSQGLPNSSTASVVLMGNGVITGGKQTILPAATVANILIAAKRFSWLSYTHQPPRPINDDRQIVTITAWCNGETHRLVDPELEDWQPLTHFVKNTLNLLGVEN